MKKIISILLISFLVTGCFNYHEIDGLAITSIIAIKKVDLEYEVKSLIVDPINDENIIYTKKGKTISEALNKIQALTKKKLYLNHLAAVIFDEDIKWQDLYEILNNFLQNTSINKNFYILMSDDNIQDILSLAADNLEANSYQFPLFLSEDENALEENSSLNSILSLMLKKGVSPLVPKIKIDDRSLKLDGAYILEKSNKISLNLDELKLVSVLNNLNNSILLASKDKPIFFKITKESLTKTLKDDTLNYHLKVKLTILEGEDEDYQTIETQLDEYFNNLFKKIKDSDVLGSANYIYENYFTKWQKGLTTVDEKIKLTITNKNDFNLEDD